MTSEEEVMLLREELEAARKELSRCRAECSSTRKLLSRKVHEGSSSTLQLDQTWAKLIKMILQTSVLCMNLHRCNTCFVFKLLSKVVKVLPCTPHKNDINLNINVGNRT